ncbi:MAG: hypothetical protein KKA19_00200, partial [Candidatus Margulisbacteria bacterium]|nr:hypothetical protein [Candidatus Margulisiibacteriota bacterium]
ITLLIIISFYLISCNNTKQDMGVNFSANEFGLDLNKLNKYQVMAILKNKGIPYKAYNPYSDANEEQFKNLMIDSTYFIGNILYPNKIRKVTYDFVNMDGMGNEIVITYNRDCYDDFVGALVRKYGAYKNKYKNEYGSAIEWEASPSSNSSLERIIISKEINNQDIFTFTLRGKDIHSI